MTTAQHPHRDFTADASPFLPSVHLAGVNFRPAPGLVQVRWLLGGRPLVSDTVFALRTLERELTIEFERDRLRRMLLIGAGDDLYDPSDDVVRSVDYDYTYDHRQLLLAVPQNHLNLTQQSFTMTLTANGHLCGQWSGTLH